MAFQRFHRELHEDIGEEALEAIAGCGVSLLTNRDDDMFWYSSRSLKKRYKQENAKVGDHFWDGNNGDKHTVVAVDLASSRIVVRNEDQNEELLTIVCW